MNVRAITDIHFERKSTPLNKILSYFPYIRRSRVQIEYWIKVNKCILKLPINTNPGIYEKMKRQTVHI